MHRKFGFSLLAMILIGVPAVRADTMYNLRASLSNGEYVTGKLSVDPATGVVTSEIASVLSGTTVVATVNTLTSQGIVMAPGSPSEFEVSSTGPASALFVLRTPALSLANYAGGQLCTGYVSGSCGASFFYQGPDLIAGPVVYAYQGLLAPASDTVTTFNLSGILDNGNRLAGTVTVDTTLGYVLDENASLYSGATLLSTFTNPGSQYVYNSGAGSDLSYVITSQSLNNYLFNLDIASGSLVAYGGGKICAESNGTKCDYSDVFQGASAGDTATVGNLTLPAAAVVTPEPSTLLLLGTGMAGLLAMARLRRLSNGL